MINLLNAEFYKLFKSKVFYICLILLVIMTAIIPWSIKLTNDMFKNNPLYEEQLKQVNEKIINVGVGISNSSLTYEGEMTLPWGITQIFSGNIILLFIAVVLTMFVTSDFHSGTIKNIATKNFSRAQIYVSKFIVLIAVVIMMFLVTLIAGVISCIIFFGTTGITGDIILKLLVSILLEILAHTSVTGIFLMIAITVRNAVATMAINICIISFITSILSLISMLFNNAIQISDYWIVQNITKVASLDLSTGDIVLSISISLIYLLISTFIGIYFFNKQDIK